MTKEGKIESKKRLVLLDMHAIIHRGYHALPQFRSSSGAPTGALYALCLMIIRIIEELKPDYIIACYDLPKKTFRHVAYKGYKAGRAKTDEDLVVQIKTSRDIINAFGIPIYDCEGFEADDLLGTIPFLLKDNKNVDIVIASGDMDTLQLVKGKKVQIFTLKKGLEDTVLIDEEGVVAKMGFLPKFIPDYKGLRGDPSDNIIGVPGIGDKTATNLICNFGTVENIYKEIKKPNFDIKKIGLTERIKDILLQNEEEAIFSKTLATIRLDAPVDFSLPKHFFYESVNTDQAKALFDAFEFRTMFKRFFGVIDNIYGGNNVQKDDANFPKHEAFYSEELKKELVIGLWLLNPEKNEYSSEEIFNILKTDDVKTAKENLVERLKKENLLFVYEKIELPLIPIIEKMHKSGISIDKKYFKKLSETYHKQLDILTSEIYEISGESFNINSPKQLGVILFEKLLIHKTIPGFRIKKTANGAFTTREEELQKLAEFNPIVKKILEYRELNKLLGTYIDVIPDYADENDRLHSKFNQCGAVTGRFSSDSPNMQNIPIKSELGNNIRKGFVSRPGFSLVSIDYSQIELRIAALLSQDEFMIKTFEADEDIHTNLAMKIFNVSKPEVTSEMRRVAKTTNFGILYGMGVSSLSQDLKIKREEAQNFYNAYFEAFPGIKAYFDNSLEKARISGFTETLFGRKRFFPLIKSKLPFLKAQAERMAMNAPIQGTATADIIKLSIIEIDSLIEDLKLEKDVFLTLQVHDELVFEVKDEIVDFFVKKVVPVMENIIPKEFVKGKNILLKVNVTVGKNWGTK